MKTVEEEVKEWRKKVCDLNNQIHTGESMTIQTEHKKNVFEIEIIDLKKQVSLSRDETK